jgi:RNA polymerase sigma-54 factor
MDLKAGLWQKQTLKLAMTQELTQAIALLQYSSQELAAFLEEKASENPLLQVDFKNIRTIDPRVGTKVKARTPSERDQKNWIDQIGEIPYSLQDHLRFQLNVLPLEKVERRIIQFYIENLDENGYLGATVGDACVKLGITEDEAENGLVLLQGLEPAGVGARSLQECLLLQLQRMKPDKWNFLAQTVLETHFMLFAEKKWKLLAKLLKLELREIQQTFDYIQVLDPRPGSAFYSEKAAYIVPDVIVREENGGLTIGMVDETVPKITFNEDYYRELAAYGDHEVARFLHEKQQDFQWILKSLEQRRETLMKVALKIVEKQPGFIRQCRSFLKPMTMKEIAGELGIHESTVSRAVREKYLQTPAGTFEMKSLFSSSIQTTELEQTSSQHAKAAIAQLIQDEDKQKPLSDQEMVELLSERAGIVISRRTVAKYREQLGIASSSKRKRFL